LRITKSQILEFVAELIKGDPNDKEYQRKIIDKLVYKVYISNGSFFALVHFFDMNKTEHITFEDINETQSNALGGSFSNSIGAPKTLVPFVVTKNTANGLLFFRVVLREYGIVSSQTDLIIHL
jgi:hypothetical protein